MPLHGYTRMFENMLDHPNIKIMLNTDYRDIEREISFKEMVYTGPVDEFFGCRYGKLPYRSLEFKHEVHDQEVFQVAPVVNYPQEHAYTRITEFKYLTGQQHAKTALFMNSRAPKAIRIIRFHVRKTRFCTSSMKRWRRPLRTSTSWDAWRRTSTTTWIKLLPRR